MVKVAIIGVGTVGKSVVEILKNNSDIIQARAGKKIEPVVGVVRNLKKNRGVDIEITDNIDEVLKIFQQLQTIIKTFDTQTKTMSQHLKTYKTLGDEAKEMTPKIANFLDVVQKNIKHVDNQIANITDRFGNEYEIYIDSLKKLLQSIPKGK